MGIMRSAATEQSAMQHPESEANSIQFNVVWSSWRKWTRSRDSYSSYADICHTRTSLWHGSCLTETEIHGHAQKIQILLILRWYSTN